MKKNRLQKRSIIAVRFAAILLMLVNVHLAKGQSPSGIPYQAIIKNIK